MPAVDEAQIDFETIELLFFAYRDFVSDPDAILAKIGMGRAHHRVVYFVSRQPGMMVTDLLDTLQITKQSLARVLKQLIDRVIFARWPAPRIGASAGSIRRLRAANWRSPFPSRNRAVSLAPCRN